MLQVRLAANSCVTKDISEPGDYGGFPAVRTLPFGSWCYLVSSKEVWPCFYNCLIILVAKCRFLYVIGEDKLLFIVNPWSEYSAWMPIVNSKFWTIYSWLCMPFDVHPVNHPWDYYFHITCILLLLCMLSMCSLDSLKMSLYMKLLFLLPFKTLHAPSKAKSCLKNIYLACLDG